MDETILNANLRIRSHCLLLDNDLFESKCKVTIPEIQKLLEQGCNHRKGWGVFPETTSIICKPCAAAAILELERVQNSVADVISTIDKALGIK